MMVMDGTDADVKALGQRIRQLRQQKNKSQQELGAYLNRTHAAISDIELGKTNLTVQDLTKIAAFFGVGINDLLEEPTTLRSRATVHYRTDKDTPPEKLKEIDKATQDFINRVQQIRQELDGN